MIIKYGTHPFPHTGSAVTSPKAAAAADNAAEAVGATAADVAPGVVGVRAATAAGVKIAVVVVAVAAVGVGAVTAVAVNDSVITTNYESKNSLK